MHSFKKLLAAIALLSCASATCAAYSGVYIFGDSLSDTGNAAALVGANPDQVISGNTYIPNQPYGSGQFTNGNVWVTAFTETLGHPTDGLPWLAGGNNFSFGGARTATDQAALAPSLSVQTSMFLSTLSGTAPNQALYVLEGGGNDARDLLAAASTSTTPATVIATGAAAYANALGQVVDRLQTAGAQNIVVWDVPNLGLAPAVRSLGAGAALLGSQVSTAMNGALAARLALEAGVSIFDIHGLQNAVVANPSAYGLSNVTDACGAMPACDATRHFYWDGLHPTEAVHSLITQGMLKTIAPAVPEPAAWALLAAGLMALGLRRMRWRNKGRRDEAAPLISDRALAPCASA